MCFFLILLIYSVTKLNNVLQNSTVSWILKMYFTIKKLKVYLEQKKPVFLFVPTIEIGEKIAPLILRLVPGGNFVHSKKVDRAKIISDFKEKRYKYLITTAVLERGVTVKDLQVIIYQADHKYHDPLDK